jgi:sec-independent protein translocase protein TatC
MPGTRNGAEMGFFDHLESLRRGVLVSLVVFILAASAAFFFMDRIMPFLLRPADRLGVKLYAFAPFEKFVAYLKASAVLGAGAAMPLAASLAAGFVSPALGAKARRSVPAIVAAVVAFMYSGVALAWFWLLPFAVRFFFLFASGDGIEPMWSLSSFVSLAAGLVAASGMVFLVPPVMLLLIRLGIVKPSTLAKSRRYAIVAIVLLAGFITPTVDVVTQSIVAGVLWALFEITLIVGKIVAPKPEALEAQREEHDGQTGIP